MASRSALPAGRASEAAPEAAVEEPAPAPCAGLRGTVSEAATGPDGWETRSGRGSLVPSAGGASTGGGAAVAGAVLAPAWEAEAALGVSGRGTSCFGSEAPKAGGPCAAVPSLDASAPALAGGKPVEMELEELDSSSGADVRPPCPAAPLAARSGALRDEAGAEDE
eukprot:6596350-Alexandrium_andersonii.AAC.1